MDGSAEFSPVEFPDFPVELREAHAPEPTETEEGEQQTPVVDRIKERFHQAGTYLGNLSAMAAVSLELNHATNEGPRAYVLAAVQESTHNTPLATAACVATTALIEGAGAIGAAQLLGTKHARQLTGWIGAKQKDAPGSSSKTWKTKAMNGVVDSGLALTLGSPATVVTHQLRNPAATKAENLKRGLWVTAGVSAATAPAGWFLASPAGEIVSRIGEGNATMFTAGTIGLAGIAGYIKKRVTNRKSNREKINNKETI